MKQQTDRSNHILSNTLIIATAIVFCALGVRRCHENREILDVEVVHSDGIDLTPVQIRSIENIGEWEFLAIADEELVDSTRHRTLGRDDRLVRIYHGTLRFGLDLRQAREGWVQTVGDSVHLQLPPVRLLSERFIDEARTRAFFESGSWSARAKEMMYYKAARQMRQRCVTPLTLLQVEENARAELTALFQTFGFTSVGIDFDKQ
ncbi:MAG: DUF4230 domain-containing protein [Bacteroidaceae bacterium]|nr:DUF4230 domain-containing protein [Bacteroidaceae bacterium]